MNEKSRSELLESLSAIVDGEATEFELRRVLKEQESADVIDERWSQYHRLGSAMRAEPVGGVDISDAVMAAIEAEPKPSTISRFVKPFGQVAVAASVAAVALIGAQQYQLAQLEPAADSSIVDAETQLPVETQEFVPPVGFEIRPQTRVVSTNPGATNLSDEVSLQIQFDQRALYQHVNDSILEHSENAAEATQDIYPMLRAPNEE